MCISSVKGIDIQVDDHLIAFHTMLNRGSVKRFVSYCASVKKASELLEAFNHPALLVR